MLLLEIQMQIPSWLLSLHLYEIRLSRIHDINLVNGRNRYLPLRHDGVCGFAEAFKKMHLCLTSLFDQHKVARALT